MSVNEETLRDVLRAELEDEVIAITNAFIVDKFMDNEPFEHMSPFRKRQVLKAIKHRCSGMGLVMYRAHKDFWGVYRPRPELADK